jgi:hypothetical protein
VKGVLIMIRRITNNRKPMKRKMKESRTLEILTYDELSPKQQQYVIKNWTEMNGLDDTIHDWFNEYTMDCYDYDKDEVANKYEREYLFDINAKELYWESNSQGPYPRWYLERVFDTYCGRTKSGVDYCIEFYGRGLDVKYDLDTDGYYDEDVEVSESDIDSKLNISIKDIINGAQSFIDEIWHLVNEACQAYPDDEWVAGTLENNPDTFEFIVTDDGRVKAY